MNGFVSKTTQANAKLATFKEHARTESLKWFHDDSRYQAICYIEKKLALHDHMTISELEKAIRFIEEMKVSSEHEKMKDFKEVLSHQFRYRTLASLGFENPLPENQATKAKSQEPNVSLDRRGSLCSFLAEVHSSLLGNYERAKLHAEGHLPVSKIRYTPNLMRQTQAVQDIENTTKAATTSDHSTSVMDIRRGGTTFYGTKINTGANDIYARPTIENFAGDKIDVPGSKANKIFHFGGQVLQAIILDEFENSMELIDGDRHLTEGLKPTVTRGTVNWSKNQETGEIYATVELKILSCAFIDPIDMSKMPEHFALRSDGISLAEIDMDILTNLDEAVKKDVDDVVPICTFKARLDMTVDPKTGEHYLKVNEFMAKINTSDIISRKDPNHQPAPSWHFEL